MSIIYQRFFYISDSEFLSGVIPLKKLISSLTAGTEYSPTLMAIYILNITDYLFTLILITSGILSGQVPYPISSAGILTDLLLKCILPLLLLIALRLKLGTSKPRHPKLLSFFLAVMMSYFFVLNFFHIFRLCCCIFLF